MNQIAATQVTWYSPQSLARSEAALRLVRVDIRENSKQISERKQGEEKKNNQVNDHDYSSWFSPKVSSSSSSWVRLRSDLVLTSLVHFGVHPGTIAAIHPVQKNRTKVGIKNCSAVQPGLKGSLAKRNNKRQSGKLSQKIHSCQANHLKYRSTTEKNTEQLKKDTAPHYLTINGW